MWPSCKPPKKKKLCERTSVREIGHNRYMYRKYEMFAALG